MNGWLQDLRLGARVLRRAPVYAITAIVALALGIGATSAIFSIVDVTLLRELPYPDSDRLVMVWERNLDRGYSEMYASPPNFRDWRDQATGLEGLSAFTTERRSLAGGAAAVAVQGAEVTEDLFAALRVAPQLGRAFDAAEARPGGPPVAVLSDALWTAQFARDRDVLGRTVELDGVATTVVGVMPPGFTFPPVIMESGPATGATDVWTPLALDEGASRSAHFLTVIARLRNGVSHESVEEELGALSARLAAAYPESNEGWTVTVVPLQRQLAGQSRGQLALLLGAVGLVLVIACINVANLLLARGTSRRQEIAVRASIGASRGRLVRQFLTESLLLGLLGGVAGLVIASVGLRAMVRLAPETVLRAAEASLDLRVVGFTLLVSVLSAVIFGLVPAWSNSSLALSEHLRDGGRGDTGARSRRRFQSAFIVGEIALSLALLVGAGLLFQTFVRLRGADVGIDARGTITAQVALPGSRYEESDVRVAAYSELGRRVQALPEVAAAGFIYDVPLAADRQGTRVTLPGADAPDGEQPGVNFSIVTAGYFDAMGIPIRSGRDFGSVDPRDGEPVAIVNQAFADQLLPGVDPIGTSFGIFDEQPRIVGVVGNVRHESLRTEGNPVAYLFYEQSPWQGTLSLVVRSRGAIDAVVEAVRTEIRRFDPGVPVYDVTTMAEVLGSSVARERFSATLFAVFSGLALGLAAVGVFGVVSYAVGRRVRETGIRMALGARAEDVLALLVRQSMRPVLVGVALGVPAAAAVAATLRGSLYGVGAADPVTFLAVVAVLVAVALAATYIPARRATRVDPAVALRAD